jgi:hypothetical protein
VKDTRSGCIAAIIIRDNSDNQQCQLELLIVGSRR